MNAAGIGHPSEARANIGAMSDTRAGLIERLEDYYRGCGWSVKHSSDGTLAAAGPGGVTWHGAAILPEDVARAGWLDERLVELAERRMPGGGELCPLDLLPTEDAEPALREALDRTGLSHRPHVSVYALTAAA